MVRDPSRLFRMGLTFGFKCISGEMACYDLGGGVMKFSRLSPEEMTQHHQSSERAERTWTGFVWFIINR